MNEMDGIKEAFLGLFIFSVYWPILIATAIYGLMSRKKRRDLVVDVIAGHQKNDK